MSLEVQLSIMGIAYSAVAGVLTAVAGYRYHAVPMGPGWTVLLWLAWLAAGLLIVAGLTIGEVRRGAYPENDHGR